MSSDPKKVVVLLAEGFEEVEATTPIDFLRRAGLEVQILGVGVGPDRIVKGSRGIDIRAELSLEAFRETPDCVVLPGGLAGAENLQKSEAARVLVQRVHEAGGVIGAICAAPGVVLGSWDMLQGQDFTCYPGFESRVPQGRHSENRVVTSGQFVTSRAAGTAAEFAIELIRVLAGQDAADKVRTSTLQAF